MIKGIVEMKTRKIVDASEMTHQIMSEIAEIGNDNLMSAEIAGEEISPARLLEGSTMPNGSRTADANTKPMVTRQNVMPRLLHKSPLPTMSCSASHTRAGPGKM